MKYNLQINQRLIVESGLPLDIFDACIIDFMHGFSLSDKIEKKLDGNKLYCWFSYEHIIKNMPLLKMEKDSVYRRLKALKGLGLIDFHPDNQKCGKSFLHLTEKLMSLYFIPTDVNPYPYGNKSVPPTDGNPNYNNINDNILLLNSKRKPAATKGIKKTKEFVAPVVQDVKNYFKEKGFTEEAAQKAFDYYDVAEWKDSSGKPVRNWKQKMISVWFKKENKIQTQSPSQKITL